MVKIRLKRMGSKYNAFYRVVAADSRAPRDGKYIEDLGFYNPHTKEFRLNDEAKNAWLEKGAVPSETVKRLFSKADALGGSNGNVIVLPKKEKAVKSEQPVITEETEEASEE